MVNETRMKELTEQEKEFEDAKKKAAEELRILAMRGPELKDKDGNIVKTKALSMEDISEIEERKDAAFSDIMTSMGTLKSDDLMFILWLGARKWGLTDDQIDKEDFVYPDFKKFKRRFNFSDLKTIMAVTIKLMEVSGLGEDGRDTEKPAKQG